MPLPYKVGACGLRASRRKRGKVAEQTVVTPLHYEVVHSLQQWWIQGYDAIGRHLEDWELSPDGPYDSEEEAKEALRQYEM